MNDAKRQTFEIFSGKTGKFAARGLVLELWIVFDGALSALLLNTPMNWCW